MSRPGAWLSSPSDSVASSPHRPPGIRKYQWLFRNVLDSVETVRRLVAFYVEAHNTQIPHSAFRGETPDEIYYGRGQGIPEQLEIAKALARAARLKANRELSCMSCEPRARTMTQTLAAAHA